MRLQNRQSCLSRDKTRREMNLLLSLALCGEKCEGRPARRLSAGKTACYQAGNLRSYTGLALVSLTHSLTYNNILESSGTEELG